MKVKQLHIILLSCIALFLVACVYDQLSDNLLPSNVKAIELTIQSVNDESATTSTNKTELGEDILNENKVENIEVYFFKTDGTFFSKIEAKHLKRLKEAKNTFNLQIRIPIDDVTDYEKEELQICVVANHNSPLPPKPTLKELRKTIEKTTLNKIPVEAQEKFLMDGMVTTKIDWGSALLYKVSDSLELQRAGTKIRLRIENISINTSIGKYSIEGEPLIRLMNYANKTNLLQGGTPYTIQANDLKSEEYQEMIERTFPNEKRAWTTSIPYYAYENNWHKDSDKETYLMVKLNLKSPKNEIKPYYYRIPVNYRLPVAGIDETELYQLKRNRLYDITSNIEVLGSEEETEPLEIESNIAIQPWIESDVIDGNIQAIHYLMVKETTPTMINTDTREVEYASDLPIEITINKVGFEWYDEHARLVKVVWEGNDGRSKVTYTDGKITTTETVDNPYDGVKITPDKDNKKLIITHTVPTNFMPFEIDFTVTQMLPEFEIGNTPLSQNVVATQYPRRYVTGEKSPGFEGTADPVGADFRFHSTLGMENKNKKAQINSVLYKITTLISRNDTEPIGDPTDPDGKTRREKEPNLITSPQFILASQHGMSFELPQYIADKPVDIPYWKLFNCVAGYGPYNKPLKPGDPYYHHERNETFATYFVSDYTTLEERCYNYFEGEYGMDGEYTEYYFNSSGTLDRRVVKKTFKYKGRWRMPTQVEVELISGLQRSDDCPLKYIMMEENYVGAIPGWVFSFSEHVWTKHEAEVENSGKRIVSNVRCVFDTYKF